MFKIPISKTVYSAEKSSRILDKEFKTFTVEQEDVTTVEDFFRLYEQLFLDIPKFGEFNSHEYLIKTSSDYIEFTSNTQNLDELLEEINSLRQRIVELQTELIQLQISIAIPSTS